MRSGVYVSRFLRAILPVMLVVLLLTGAGLFAQERFSTINGVVYDSSKAVLQGAEVTITNLETKRTTTLTTGDGGRYLARDLEPGRYSISAQKTGFSKAEYPDVILLLGKTISMDFTLQVGEVKETIVVSGSVAMIDTNTTAVTHNVTSDEFDNMPKSRTFQSVALTSPSVNSGVLEGGIQVNGASGAENQFTIDGISTTSQINGSSRQDASYEYLQEVQVKTSGIDAEYGGALGGVISAVTKSGGNAFHGEFHWYNSGSAFNAIQNKRLTTTSASPYRVAEYFQDQETTDSRNEFGGSMGGPIVKDKLYFFTSYSPLIRHREATVTFSDGDSKRKSKQISQNLFNKVSWDATKRIRTNFSWLYTTTRQDGTIPAYSAMAENTNVNTISTYDTYVKQGWYLPKNSYTGTVDITLSNTALLSLRGGYFWDNYKDLNTSPFPQTIYQTGNVGQPGVPADVQHNAGWYNIPSTSVNYYDITSRAFFQADYSVAFRFVGTHTFKAGAGMQKNINTVNTAYQGGGARTMVYWGDVYNSPTFGPVTGLYGYYVLRLRGTQGSAGSTIDNLYAQDQWRIHSRLTLNLGLRVEKENIPSMRQDIKPGNAISFGWGDKIAPRLGASFDVLGNGKLKIFGSWGLFYDWTKYTLVRGSFGGDTWREWYHALDTTDVFSINMNNMPGRNLWNNIEGSYRDMRIPSFGPNDIDPNIKPMRQQTAVVGADYQFNSATVISAHWVHSRLNRTIEDIGSVLADGNTVYPLGNPGEGAFKYETNHISSTPDFLMPKPNRSYDALELSFSRRFSAGWFLGANYTFSRLYGNYSGINDTDEVNTWASTQEPQGGISSRDGSNTNLFYDDESFLVTSKGVGTEGRLPTDRPHVFKAFGSYTFKFGTSVSGNFYIGSGTPMTTLVENNNWDPMFVNGRGDMGRTPVLSQTDLMVAHEFKIKEGKTLRFEFNMLNLFNQRQVRHIDPQVNRFRITSSGMDLSEQNLLNGFDWRYLLSQTPYAQTTDPTKWYYTSDPTSLDPLQNSAISPTYNKADVWNNPFTGRFGVKFVF